jgi:S-formylglutathione hydrolase
MSLELIACNQCFGGEQRRYKAHSKELSAETVFSVFIPGQSDSAPVPVLYYLSGLTCTDENAVTKAGAQRMAAKLGMALIFPDTSPRGDDVPDDAEASYDFGLGAGFYLNATQPPWQQHYRMESYVVDELPQLLVEIEGLDLSKSAIFGHSMGGHGAMTLALKNPGRYASVSAFSPICAPASCPWGEKAFMHYLGPDRSTWRNHDASELIREGATPPPLMIDQGGADAFLQEQLKPELLLDACRERGLTLSYRLHEGYDHSYFFIASFMEDHLRFHASHLGLA